MKVTELSTAAQAAGAGFVLTGLVLLGMAFPLMRVFVSPGGIYAGLLMMLAAALALPGLTMVVAGGLTMLGSNGARALVRFIAGWMVAGAALLFVYQVRSILVSPDWPKGNFPRSSFLIIMGSIALWNAWAWWVLRRAAASAGPARGAHWIREPVFAAALVVIGVVRYLLWAGGFHWS